MLFLSVFPCPRGCFAVWIAEKAKTESKLQKPRFPSARTGYKELHMKVSMWSTMKHCRILEILSTIGWEQLFQRLSMPKCEDFENLPTSEGNRIPCEHVRAEPCLWTGARIQANTFSPVPWHVLPGPAGWWHRKQGLEQKWKKKKRRDLEKHIPARTLNCLTLGSFCSPLYVGD